MPIIIRGRSDDHTGDLIKKFKKIMAATNIIQVVKDRKYYQKPSELRSVKMNELRRMRKRMRSLKKQKNVVQQRPPVRKVRPERRDFAE